MALRIDTFNKKLAALNVELVRDEDEGQTYFYVIDTETEDQLGEMITVAKINDLTEAQWMEEINERIAEREVEEESDDEESDEEDDSTMAGTLNKYRPGYVKTVNWSGSASVDNGDEVAEMLRGLNPDETCAIADHLFGEIPGTHFAKYQYLNRGQRRMNAGNRIRALIKRGEKTAADLQAAIRGDDLVDDETAV
ncbi:hypothetical protein D3C76_283700 [compost metagenome]